MNTDKPTGQGQIPEARVIIPDSVKPSNLSYLCVITALLLGLYACAFYSYILFHTLVELAAVAIAFSLFILTWNTQRFQENAFLRIVGIGYAFIALIDLLHTLAYKGMNVFPGFDANLATQLWIAARSLQAVTLCAAPLFMKRSVDNRALFAIYSGAVAALVLSIFSGNFPACFIEGRGLTSFKTNSEYVITTLLFASICLLYGKRRYFNDKVFFLTLSSIACTAISEISFTTYLNVYGFANMAGHFFKLAAFYLIYRAILVTGLKDPFDLIFRELRETEEALRKSHDSLEEKVRVRTAELRAREEKYRALIECANDAVFIHEIRKDGMPGPFIEVNELACRRLGYSREELASLSPLEIDDPRYRDRIAPVMERLLTEGHALFETAQMAKDGRSIPVEVSTRLLELDGRHLLFSLVRDITERKRMEEALGEKEREYRTLVENIPDFIVRYDSGLHRIFVNPAWEKASGLSAAEVMNMPATDIPNVPKAAVPEYLEKLNTVLETGTSQSLEFVWVNARGAKLYLDYTIVPEYDKHGNVISVLSVGHDITDRKLAEEEARKLNEELELRVRERTAELERKNQELERLNRLFTGRELRMAELKKKIREQEKGENSQGGYR